MKTAFVVACTLISYGFAQQGGARFNIEGISGEASTDGKEKAQFQAGDFAGKISTNMDDRFDVKVGDKKDVQLEDMSPNARRSTEDDMSNFNVSSIDPELLRQLNLTAADLNATSFNDAVNSSGYSAYNVNWCADFYPREYLNGSCNGSYDDFMMQVRSFEEMVQNVTGGNSSSNVDYKEMRAKNIKITNKIDINFDDDIKFKVSMSEDNKFTEMRIKFLKYFDWALIQGVSDKYTNMMDTCENECGIDSKRDMCCTTVKMYQKDSKNALTQLQCMNEAMSDMSTGVWIDDYYYEYECRKGDWDSNKARSSAISLAVGAASLLATISFM